MYYTSRENVQRVLRVFENWQFTRPRVVLESWLPDDDPNYITIENEPEGAVKPYALLLGGQARSIALALQRADSANYKTDPEAWLERLLDGLGREHGELEGPPAVVKAKAALKKSLVASLE